jgi:hypothetical protein
MLTVKTKGYKQITSPPARFFLDRGITQQIPGPTGDDECSYPHFLEKAVLVFKHRTTTVQGMSG